MVDAEGWCLRFFLLLALLPTNRTVSRLDATFLRQWWMRSRRLEVMVGR